MTSDSEVPEGVPTWVVDRVLRLLDDDPLHFLRDRIPALGNRTVPEVLATPGGHDAVSVYLSQLDDLVGVRIPWAEIVPDGLDLEAIARHPEFARTAPGWATHCDGWRVGFSAPNHVGHWEGDNYAGAPADLSHGADVAIEGDALMCKAPHYRTPTDDERTVILKRIVAGLIALGAQPTVFIGDANRDRLTSDDLPPNLG